MARSDFPRQVDALEAITAFTATALGDAADAELRHVVDFTIEELFTNMVKYAPGGARIDIEIECSAEGVEVTLTDTDVALFDPTQAPDVDIDAPIGERRPGGLGLHLVRRLVDVLDYRYDPARREGRTHFRVGPRPPRTSC
jgi:anti-sigma regulatory factor (Ser/Thr protein kinase)